MSHAKVVMKYKTVKSRGVKNFHTLNVCKWSLAGCLSSCISTCRIRLLWKKGFLQVCVCKHVRTHLCIYIEHDMCLLRCMRVQDREEKHDLILLLLKSTSLYL